MTNRNKLALLVAFTLGAALTNGCIAASEPAPTGPFGDDPFSAPETDDRVGPPLCEHGSRPCPIGDGEICVSQDLECSEVAGAAMDDSPDADLPLGAVDPGPCEPGVDHVGCPGNECAHGHCWVGECVGRVVDDEGTQVDPGVCCTDEECCAE